MSNRNGTPPVATHRDGAVSAKVWRNHSQDGEAFYSVTLQRSYKDKQTGEFRDTASFQGTDLLKVQQLASQAYGTISRLRENDRQAARAEPEKANGLAAQRDQIMESSAPAQPQREADREPEM